MTSLHARLGVAVFLALALTIGLLFVIAAVSLHAIMEQQVATRLDHDAESLLGGLVFLPDGSYRLDLKGIQGIYHRTRSGHYYRFDVDGLVLKSASLAASDLPAADLQPGERSLLHVRHPDGEPLLMRVIRTRVLGHDVQLAVAESLSTLRSGVRRIWAQLLAGAAVMVILVVLLQRYIIAHSLRPIDRALDDMVRLERGEIKAMNERQVPREVLPLVRAINMLLARQRERLRRSRETVGNMAHAIKTPLTLLQQLAGEKVGEAETRTQMQHYIRTIDELVDTALRRARIAGDSLGGNRFDLRRDLPGLVDTLERLHRDKSIRFGQRLDGNDTLPLDQQDGMELLGNLLDNAWKWARGAVEFGVERRGGELLLTIEDDGPGVDEARRDQLLRRGVRHDESTHGHGIGLSIVDSLVSAAGGDIALGCSQRLGGLQVSIRLRCPEVSPPSNFDTKR